MVTRLLSYDWRSLALYNKPRRSPWPERGALLPDRTINYALDPEPEYSAYNVHILPSSTGTPRRTKFPLQRCYPPILYAAYYKMPKDKWYVETRKKRRTVPSRPKPSEPLSLSQPQTVSPGITSLEKKPNGSTMLSRVADS